MAPWRPSLWPRSATLHPGTVAARGVTWGACVDTLLPAHQSVSDSPHSPHIPPRAQSEIRDPPGLYIQGIY